MSQKVLILSPHLDDAALSCADHISVWRSQGIRVTVITIFTKYTSHTLRAYENQRKHEDGVAMKRMNVRWEQWNYVDGVCRGVYDKTQLFSGKVNDNDGYIFLSLRKKLMLVGEYDKVIVPLGVGGHVDHSIVKTVAESVFVKQSLSYYIDCPYASRWTNWSLVHVGELLRKRRSVRAMSTYKQEILQVYASQYCALFQRSPRFFEIILT